MCGATVLWRLRGWPGRGLSPRVRGNPPSLPRKQRQRGSIPACAGQPSWGTATSSQRAVYPRVCGATTPARVPCQTRAGLSPRVRGNRQLFSQCLRAHGSIPACAGQPLCRTARWTCWPVYPRVCGATPGRPRTARSLGGLSPRVRGNLFPRSLFHVRYRSIPACAGQPILYPRRCFRSTVYPRVCGATPPPPPGSSAGDGLSPRVRGNRGCRTAPAGAGGSIPACAGQPPVSRR